jgi:2'-5' RNA ligase
MANLVIVAIPAADDDVWKVSSEKVPHMTYLFLGDAMSNPNVTKISDKVKEVAGSLGPFSLRVDHRGTMGPDEADVLYFSQDVPWQVADFRQILLGDVNIRSAYNSIQQHTEWTPHLTLGYPDTPANADTWDPSVPQYVSFDKVATWFGDFEGIEVPLFETAKNNMGMDSPAMAWSERIIEGLKHHGVKGMRWGVRRARGASAVTVTQKGKKLKSTGGQGRPAHPDAIKAKTIGQVRRKSGAHALSNDELRLYQNRLQLEQQVKRLDYNQKSAAKKFVAGLLGQTGKSAAQTAANEAASKQVKKILLKTAVVAA